MWHKRDRLDDLRPEAEAPSGSGERESTDVLRPQHLAHALAAKRSDASWDSEDETTIYRRGSDVEPVAAVPARRLERVSEEPDLAVEGALARSLAPVRRQGLRASWLLWPSCALLVGSALWSARGHSRSFTDLWQLERKPTLRPQAAARPAPVLPPSAAGSMLAAEPIATALPVEPAAGAWSGELIIEPIASEPAPPSKLARARALRERRAAWLAAVQRRRQASKTRAQSGAVARPIQPLREPAVALEDDGPDAAPDEGTLRVNSRPWARVLVDGRFVGNTPQRALRLRAGAHRVHLVNEPLDMSKLLEVTIAPGQIITRVELLDENPR
jgi:hypothetical protein